MVNLFPREVPRVLNLFPRELIESTPKDFLNANPKLHQRPDPWPKTRGAALYNGLFGLHSPMGLVLVFRLVLVLV